MALLPWRKSIITKIEQHTHNTRRFFFSVPDTTEFNFTPGQFVTLDLPIHEKLNKRIRSYSIASAPDGTNQFELLIVQAKDGLGTGYLFAEAKEGAEITFRGPLGMFTLPQPIDKDLFLICTGTGLAPFRSMINAIKKNNTPHKNIYLLFGCRHKADLLYYDELRQLEKDLPGFTYIPTLSREQWEGRTGYVHSVYTELCSNKQPAHFFLCGWRDMIDEARKRIAEMGYDKKDVHLELYG